jgi:hypothetical protein
VLVIVGIISTSNDGDNSVKVIAPSHTSHFQLGPENPSGSEGSTKRIIKKISFHAIITLRNCKKKVHMI